MNITQLGASTASLAGCGLHEAINTIRGLGLGGIEILAFEGARHSIGDLAGVWLDTLPAGGCERLRAELAGFRHVTTHAPFIDLPVFTHNTGIRREALRQLREAIAGTRRIGGTATAVHAHPKTGFSLEETWQEMVDTFRSLGDVGSEHAVRVCLETMYPPTVESFAEFIHAVNHPFVGATIDTGHVAWTVPQALRGTDEGVALYNDNLNRLLMALGSKVYHFHVHDVRRHDWRDHRECGAGCIDWERLCATANRIAYAGSFPFEFEEPDRAAARARSRQLLCECLGK